jgi:hypothetical protein
MSNARPLVAQINLPKNLSLEGPTQSAWHLTVQSYFPVLEPRATPTEFTTWQVLREPYRMVEGQDGLKKPDVIAVKTRTTTVGPQGTTEDVERDVLTIECKAPNENTQSGWRNLINESIERLAYYSPQQSTFLITAVGSSYMFFFWNHAAPPNAPPLTICTHGTIRRPFDKRLRPLGNAKWFPNMTTATGRPANTDIRLDIECLGAESILGDEQSNFSGVKSLENFLTAVRGSQLHGPNVFG